MNIDIPTLAQDLYCKLGLSRMQYEHHNYTIKHVEQALEQALKPRVLEPKCPASGLNPSTST